MLVGRESEQRRLDQLLADARSGRSDALVVVGEAGIGKTALLEHACAAARDLRVVRGVGVETEAELPFGGLYLLLRPYLDRIDALPGPQAAALGAAFGLSDAPVHNRFLIGAATLTLLDDLAAEAPLLCVIDDAQWLDQASLDALLFAARRLHADPIAMVFAVRETGQPFPARGLEVLRLTGLPHADAAALLDGHAPRLTTPVRERVLEESGNPLGLIELATAINTAERSERSGPGLAQQVGPLQVTERVQEVFRGQIAELPEATHLLLAVAAADGAASVDLVLGVAGTLGVAPADLASAERANLVTLSDDRVAFRHPLVRAAAYQSIPQQQRMAVHLAFARALAGAEDADRRAWHLAAATTRPDEQVAIELERAARRAQRRGGAMAVSAAYERAARLSTGADAAARRLVDAARGRLRRRPAGPGDTAGRRGRLAHRRGRHRRRGDLRGGAGRLRTRLAGRGRDVGAAGGVPDHRAQPGTGRVDAGRGDGGRQGRLRPRPRPPRRPAPPGADPAPGLGPVALGRGADRVGAPVRRQGGPGRRPDASAGPGGGGPANGQLPRSRDRRVLRTDDRRRGGHDRPDGVHAGRGQGRGRAHLDPVHAADPGARPAAPRRVPGRRGMRGRRSVPGRGPRHGRGGGGPERDRGLAGGGVGRRAPLPVTCRRSAGARRAASHQRRPGRLGARPAGPGRRPSRGRARPAGRRLQRPARHDFLIRAVPDLVEAAVRSGQPDRTQQPLAALDHWARHTGSPLATALSLRCHALTSPGGEADELYNAALRTYQTEQAPYDEARARLAYGEWLRRRRRRADARTQLTQAMAAFERLGAAGWAGRARAELQVLGTGRPPRSTRPTCSSA